MASILVVEDTAEFRLLVKASLGARFTLEFADSAKEALTRIQAQAFDLIVLDVGLPDQDGFTLLPELRKTEHGREVPVIFLTGHNDVSDKVRGFALGAEDYVVKPFDGRELLARVDSRLSRHQTRAQATEWMLKGPLKISLIVQRATLIEDGADMDLDLTPLEFKLLNFLARNEDKVMSRDELLVSVWGAGVHVVNRTIDKHICGLRAKLRSAAESIQTIPGRGYRFSIPKNGKIAA